MKKHEMHQMKIRIPMELRDWIADSAQENHRTMTAEVEFHLEKARIGSSQKEATNAATA